MTPPTKKGSTARVTSDSESTNTGHEAKSCAGEENNCALPTSNCREIAGTSNLLNAVKPSEPSRTTACRRQSRARVPVSAASFRVSMICRRSGVASRDAAVVNAAVAAHAVSGAAHGARAAPACSHCTLRLNGGLPACVGAAVAGAGAAAATAASRGLRGLRQAQETGW